jgi:hypothetical protein
MIERRVFWRMINNNKVERANSRRLPRLRASVRNYSRATWSLKGDELHPKNTVAVEFSLVGV